MAVNNQASWRDEHESGPLRQGSFPMGVCRIDRGAAAIHGMPPSFEEEMKELMPSAGSPLIRIRQVSRNLPLLNVRFRPLPDIGVLG